MHRPILFRPSAFLAALLATTAPAFAQDDTVLTGPIPDWANMVEPLALPDGQRGIAFLHRGINQIHLTEDGQQVFTYSHVSLLHPTALQLGNVALTWNPASGAPTMHRLAIIRDGETIDVLADAEFEVLRREDQLEAARLDGLLTASYRVPDLRVGDEIEIAYTVPSRNPTLPDTDFGALFVLPEPTEGRVQLQLTWEDDADAPRYRISPDITDDVEIGERAITLAGDDFGPITAPRSAPPRYAWQRIIEYTDFESWRAISQRFDGLFDEARQLDADSPLIAEAARIARAHDSEMARTQAALDLVTQQVRYIYVGLNTGAFTPATADETWDRRYGDCKGKTALLLALLDQLGIEAEPVLVNNSGGDDGLDEKLPNPGMFDHVLVRAVIDGEEYWLDGTLPGVAVPTQRASFPYRWVLPLADAGADIEPVTWQPHAEPQEISLYNIDASAGFDQPAIIETTVITRGLGALAEYAQFSTVTDAQLENAVRNNLVGSSQWDTIDHVEWRFDEERQASIFTINGTGPVDWERQGAGGRSFALPGGGFSPPPRRQREAGQDQDAPYLNEDYFACHVTSVRIPDATKADEWSFNSAFDTDMYGNIYRRMFAREGRTLRMIRIARTEELEIGPERAARDNRRLTNFDNSMAWISYTPGESWPSASPIPVPAVDERDWLADPSACDPQYGYID